ncbi:hypothetical protein [Timonella sp. A28]|uniref:hypothetical protein n=1 Tax=Timonella sp. A28 TaxID=3442640 RepID=UPI003EB991DC
MTELYKHIERLVHPRFSVMLCLTLCALTIAGLLAMHTVGTHASHQANVLHPSAETAVATAHNGHAAADHASDISATHVTTSSLTQQPPLHDSVGMSLTCVLALLGLFVFLLRPSFSLAYVLRIRRLWARRTVSFHMRPVSVSLHQLCISRT